MAGSIQQNYSLDAEGLWLDFPLQEEGGVYRASIFDCHGRRLAGDSFVASQAQDKYRWKVDHTNWPKGQYVLVLKGARSLRQTMLIK